MKRLIAASAAAAVLALVTFADAGPAAAESAPYSDPMATGYIGFCDAHGKSIQSGSLDAIPFVAKAISSTGVKAPYNAPGSSAWLNAYQPRQGVTPPEWSGEQLISASLFSTAAHPAVVGTKGDISLRQFVQDAPPQWDGFVQLRMYVKAPTTPYDALHYAATDIQVSGNSWHVVRGGTVSCQAGSGRSIGALLAPVAASGKYNQPVKPEKSTPGSTPSGPTGAGSSTASAGVAGTDSGSGSGSGAAQHAPSSSFPTGYVVLGALVAVLALALLMTQRQKLQAVLVRRRDSTDAT
jgi:hypothetical protein